MENSQKTMELEASLKRMREIRIFLRGVWFNQPVTCLLLHADGFIALVVSEKPGSSEVSYEYMERFHYNLVESSQLWII